MKLRTRTLYAVVPMLAAAACTIPAQASQEPVKAPAPLVQLPPDVRPEVIPTTEGGPVVSLDENQDEASAHGRHRHRHHAAKVAAATPANAPEHKAQKHEAQKIAAADAAAGAAAAPVKETPAPATAVAATHTHTGHAATRRVSEQMSSGRKIPAPLVAVPLEVNTAGVQTAYSGPVVDLPRE